MPGGVGENSAPDCAKGQAVGAEKNVLGGGGTGFTEEIAPASMRALGLAAESSVRRFRSSRRRKCQGLLFFALGAHIPAYRSVLRASGVMGASV